MSGVLSLYTTSYNGFAVYKRSQCIKRFLGAVLTHFVQLISFSFSFSIFYMSVAHTYFAKFLIQIMKSQTVGIFN